MRIQHCFLLTLLLSVSLSADAFWGSACKATSSKDKPGWVSAAYGYKKAGFEHGFSAVPYAKDQSYEQQLAVAQASARSDLAKSLRVVVDDSLNIHTSVRESAKREARVRRNVSRRINTHSALDIPELDLKATWQDRKTCTIYALVELPSNIAGLVLKKALADSLYQQAQDESLKPKQRLALLDNAVALAKQWDFSRLANSPSSAAMLKQYAILKQHIGRQLRNKHNAIFVVVDQHSALLKTELIKWVSTAVQGSFTSTECAVLESCLTLAKNTSAQFATVVMPDMSVKKNESFYVGTFNLNLSVWNLSKNIRIYSSSEDSALQNVRAMGRQRYALSLSVGYNKWLQLNGALKKRLPLIFSEAFSRE